MADPFKGKRARADAAVEKFIDDWIEPLADYINTEKNVEKLERANFGLYVINNLLTDKSLFAPKVWNEQEFKELKAATLKNLVEFRTSMIPKLEEYINQETNLEKLQSAISELARINGYLLGLFAVAQGN